MDPYAPLADVYEEWSAQMTEDVPFYVELARTADGPVVELAVGTGRVAVPVAAAIGRPVIGIDHSPTMLAKARAASEAAGVGRFAWNAFAFDFAIAANLQGNQDEPVPHSVRHAVGDNRIDITLDSGGSTSLWWATKNEWLGLIDVAGLEVEALSGGFDKRPFDDESREFVWVARKPG